MRSIAELSAEANSYEFSSQVSFAKWVHVCTALLRESRVYDAEGDRGGLEHAYVLYLRFADLVLNKLCTHPEFGANRKVWAQMAGLVPNAIDRSEQLKQVLLLRKEEKVDEEDFVTRELKKYEGVNFSGSSDLPARVPPLPTIPPQLLRAGKTFPNKVPPVAPLPPRVAPLPPRVDPLPPRVDPLPPRVDPLPPRVAPAAPASRGAPVPVKPAQAAQATSDLPHPLHPPKYSALSDQPAPACSAPLQPMLDLPVEAPRAEIRSIYSTERGRPLRHVFVPRALREKFLAFAEPNTKANLETCGMLCGKLSRNAFFVTDLVVPHQESTPDSCGTTNEEELFAYVDQRDLFIVGWIHTHPTQTCFMSSVDLHTHASYQLMLPEAVAVVCAPTAVPDWSAFRLTDPPGIDVIRDCTLSGFHPHSDADSLYCVPQHYKELEFAVSAVDLR